MLYYKQRKCLIFCLLATSAGCLFCVYNLLDMRRNILSSLGGDDFLGLAQDDPRLIQHIRRQIVRPLNLPYNLYHQTSQRDFSEHSQPKYLLQVLKIKKNGFFVEVGANDGETLSNTFYFENMFNWTGLLIECVPENFQKLARVHRRAYILQACLCPGNKSSLITFAKRGNSLHGGIPLPSRQYKGSMLFQYRCYPFYSILAALDLPKVDLLSLDIEGAELTVLKTLPLNKMDIRVLLVEFLSVKGGLTALKTFLAEQGYTFKKKLPYDAIFVKEN